jgi:hypothetical protein
MLKEIREWVHLALVYGLLYSTALVVLVLGIAHISNNNTQAHQNTSHTIIYKTEVVRGSTSGYEPGVCTRIDGCIVRDGVCLTCTQRRL